MFTLVFALSLPAVGEARKAVGTPQAFIAVSGAMPRDEAKAFCQQKGGKLPRINNSDSFASADRDKIAHIDGFGVPGRPWAEVELPNDFYYWTGTVYSDTPDYSLVVTHDGGKVSAGNLR